MIIHDNCWTSLRRIIDDDAIDTFNSDCSTNQTQTNTSDMDIAYGTTIRYIVNSMGFYAGYFYDDPIDTWTSIIVQDIKKAKRNLGPSYNDFVPKYYYPPINIPARIQLDRRIMRCNRKGIGLRLRSAK